MSTCRYRYWAVLVVLAALVGLSSPASQGFAVAEESQGASGQAETAPQGLTPESYVRNLYGFLTGDWYPTDYQVSWWQGRLLAENPASVVAAFARQSTLGQMGFSAEQGARALYAGVLGNAEPSDQQVWWWAQRIDEAGVVEAAVEMTYSSAFAQTVEACGLRAFTPTTSAASLAVSRAYELIGTPYSQLDCSALTTLAYNWGVDHWSFSQYQWVCGLGTFTRDLGRLQPGDLVFYSRDGGATTYHVALYVGNGQVIASLPADGVQLRDIHHCEGCIGGGSPYPG